MSAGEGWAAFFEAPFCGPFGAPACDGGFWACGVFRACDGGVFWAGACRAGCCCCCCCAGVFCCTVGADAGVPAGGFRPPGDCAAGGDE